MSATDTAAYTVAHKAVLPLLGGIVAPIIGVLVYRLSRRRLRLKDTIKTRSHLFYRILSGVLLGQFLCHTTTVGGAWGLTYGYLFILAGYVAVDMAEGVGRMWNTNTNYVGPLDHQVRDDDIALDKERMEEKTVAVVEDVSSNDFSTAVWTVEDQIKDRSKRQWVLAGLTLVLACVTVMDGMMLVYRAPADELHVTALVACFYVNGISLTVAYYGAMLHAKMHVNPERRARVLWWAFLTLIWAAMLACAAIPVLIDMNAATAISIVDSIPFVVTYGLAAGAILKLQQYFYTMKMDDADWRELLIGRLVFVLAVGQSAATGFWL